MQWLCKLAATANPAHIKHSRRPPNCSMAQAAPVVRDTTSMSLRAARYVPLGADAPDWRIVALDTGTTSPGRHCHLD